MHRLFLYPSDTFLFAMNCFTSSGSFRLACLLMHVNALSTNLMLYSLLALFFMFASMFRMFDKVGVGCSEFGVVFRKFGLVRWL